MPRIIIPVPPGSRAVNIPGEKAHYLNKVLRCRVGDEIQILDGSGTTYKAVLRSLSQKEAFADILHSETTPTESPIDLILAQGLLKGEKMDLVIQKTTELGIKEIVPLVTERSQVRETKRNSRWRKIAEEASRQSGRTAVPCIREAMRYADIFSDSAAPSLFALPPQGFLFWEKNGVSLQDAIQNLKPVFSPLLLLIGPEGGFNEQEVALARGRGLDTISMGKRILRAETAAIAATALLQFLLGDLHS